jgi:hypothetical protein
MAAHESSSTLAYGSLFSLYLVLSAGPD